MTSETVFGAYGISFSSPTHSLGTREKILDELSFEIARGEWLAVIGPNGSGKSTLLKMIAGILPYHRKQCSGQVRFLGVDFLRFPAYKKAQNVAYVASELRAEFPLTVLEAVALGRNCQNLSWPSSRLKENHRIIQEVMERCFCWHLRDRYLESLSGGERQLVTLARALAQGARVLLLDEVMSKMDLNHQALIGAMLKDLTKKGISIVLVSHDLNLATEWADTALFMKEGKKVVQGPVADVFTQDRIEKMYPHSKLIVGVNPATGAPKVFFGKPG